MDVFPTADAPSNTNFTNSMESGLRSSLLSTSSTTAPWPVAALDSALATSHWEVVVVSVKRGCVGLLGTSTSRFPTTDKDAS